MRRDATRSRLDSATNEVAHSHTILYFRNVNELDYYMNKNGIETTRPLQMKQRTTQSIKPDDRSGGGGNSASKRLKGRCNIRSAKVPETSRV